MISCRGIAGALSAALILCIAAPSHPQSPSGPGQDPLAGSRVFGSKGCSHCHSVDGIGGRIGPDLARVGSNRSFHDLAAAMWNHLPQMAGEARKRSLAFPRLSSREAGDLIAFLFTLSYLDAGGNEDSGRKLFAQKQCVRCHQIGGIGGVIGPQLDALARTGSPMNLAAAMWNHGPAMSEVMRAQGVRRPVLTASELRDLAAYLRAAAPRAAAGPVSILPGNPADGRILFEKKHCIRCHNVRGTGGEVGPDLGRRGLYRDLIEFAAALWNKAPAMSEEMKKRKIAIPSLTPTEMADIVSYLRSFQYFGEPGSPALGRQLVAEKGCLACHSLGPAGARGAPDLSRFEAFDPPASVIAALWNHGEVVTKAAGESAAWPQLTADEMAHLLAYFERPKGRPR